MSSGRPKKNSRPRPSCCAQPSRNWLTSALNLSKLTNELSERSTTAESRQTELAAVRGQVDELQNRVKSAERDYTETQQRLATQRSDAEHGDT